MGWAMGNIWLVGIWPYMYTYRQFVCKTSICQSEEEEKYYDSPHPPLRHSGGETLYWESIALNFYKYISSTTVTSGEHVFVGVYGWSNGVPDGFPTHGNVWLLEQQESTQTR